MDPLTRETDLQFAASADVVLATADAPLCMANAEREVAIMADAKGWLPPLHHEVGESPLLDDCSGVGVIAVWVSDVPPTNVIRLVRFFCLVRQKMLLGSKEKPLPYEEATKRAAELAATIKWQPAIASIVGSSERYDIQVANGNLGEIVACVQYRPGNPHRLGDKPIEMRFLFPIPGRKAMPEWDPGEGL
jgi:hypothetical protein